MDLTGLSVAWRLAHARYGVPGSAANAIAIAAVTAFVLILLAYLVKAVTAPDAVKTEFNHPIAGNMFGTFLISVLLLPIVVAPVSLLLARIMWGAGAIAMVAFAWLMVSRWMSDRQLVAHATPAWIVRTLVGIRPRLGHVARLVEAGQLMPRLDPRRYRLAETAAAHDVLEAGGALGKLVVDVTVRT